MRSGTQARESVRRDPGSERSEDGFRSFLRREKLAMTRQRERIIEAVLATDDHFSVEGLSERLKQGGARVGTATIYRTLALLVQGRLLREHDFGDGHRTYERLDGETPHDHLICERCGAVFEFEEPSVEAVQCLVVDRHEFVVRCRKLELYGLCRRCAEERADPGARGGGR